MEYSHPPNAMQCANCPQAPRGTVELHVCSAECAQDVGAILSFGKKKPELPALWVQGVRANEWNRATEWQRDLYTRAMSPQNRGIRDWEMLGRWYNPSNRADVWTIIRIDGDYYLYRGDDAGASVRGRKYLIWEAPSVQPPKHQGASTLNPLSSPTPRCK